MAIRYSKAHTTPFRVEIDFAEATNLGLEQAMEIGWTRRPLGADPASSVTAHIEWTTFDVLPAVTATATTPATVYGYRVDAAGFADYVFRVRLQNSRGFGEWSPPVEIVQP